MRRYMPMLPPWRMKDKAKKQVRMHEICQCFNREGWKTKTCLEKEKWHVKSVNASGYANTSIVKDERWKSKKKCECIRYVNASTVKDEIDTERKCQRLRLLLWCAVLAPRRTPRRTPRYVAAVGGQDASRPRDRHAQLRLFSLVKTSGLETCDERKGEGKESDHE